MSDSPVPLKEGEPNPDEGKSLRLSDAEKIAAERMDSGAENLPSGAPPGLPQEPASPSVRLTDRIDDLRTDDNQMSLAGEPIGVGAEISDHVGEVLASDLGAREHQDHVAQPLGTATNFTNGPPNHPPHDLAPASADLPGDEAAIPGHTLMRGLPVLPPLLLRANDTGQDASAVGEAIKLSEKAKAAADSLDSLKRLLEQQMPVPSKPQGRPPVPRELAPRAPLPPFPVLRSEPVPGPGITEQAATSPEPLLPPPVALAPKQRARLDVRGFLAGFALSGAIGVVLYLFMTAG